MADLLPAILREAFASQASPDVSVGVTAACMPRTCLGLATLFLL